MTVGLISLAGYLPAKPVPQNRKTSLVAYLRSNTRLPEVYIEDIERAGQLPRKIRNQRKAGATALVRGMARTLAEKKRLDPFQGATASGSARSTSSTRSSATRSRPGRPTTCGRSSSPPAAAAATTWRTTAWRCWMAPTHEALPRPAGGPGDDRPSSTRSRWTGSA